jgi:hypothetical protein
MTARLDKLSVRDPWVADAFVAAGIVVVRGIGDRIVLAGRRAPDRGARRGPSPRREPGGTDRTEWQYSLTRKSMISVRRCCLKSPS